MKYEKPIIETITWEEKSIIVTSTIEDGVWEDINKENENIDGGDL